MCITAAATGPNFTLCAADARWSLDTGVIDAGSKVRRVPNGWVGATGSAPVVARALRKLEEHGLDAVAKHIAAAYNEVAAQLNSVTPSCFLSVRDDGTLLQNFTDGDWNRVRQYGGRLSADGACDAVVPPVRGGFNFRLSLPPGVTRDEERECAAQLKAAVGKAKDVNDIVVAVAKAFVYAYERDSVTMSAEFECGATVGGRPLHTRCEAAQAARGVLRFTDPPVLPPFPELEPERKLFTLIVF